MKHITRKEMKWVGIDLDDCIAHSTYPHFELEKPLNGVRRGLRAIRDKGYKIIIHTSRPSADYINIEKWLIKNKIPFDRIVTGKELCVMYIDDKGFRLKNWDKDIKEILEILER